MALQQTGQPSVAAAPFAPRDVLAAAVGAVVAALAFAWGVVWPLIALAVAGVVLASVELWRVLRSLLSRRLRQALRMETGDLPLHLRPSWLLLPDVERARFANIAVQALWPFVRASVEPTLHTAIDAALEKSRPAAVLSKLYVSQLSLGNVPPELTGIKAYHPGANEYIVDMQVRVAADTAALELTAVPRGFTSLPLRVSVADLAIQATVRVEARPLLPRPPFVGALHVSLLQPPTVDFQLRALGIDVLGSVPGLAPLLSAVLRHEIYRFALFPRSVTIALPGAELPAGEAGAAAASSATTSAAGSLPGVPKPLGGEARRRSGSGSVGLPALAPSESTLTDDYLRINLADPRLGRICVAQPKLARPPARSRRATSDTSLGISAAGGSPRASSAQAGTVGGGQAPLDGSTDTSGLDLDSLAPMSALPPLPWAERDGVHMIARQRPGRCCATLLLHVEACHGISVRPSRAAAVLNLRGAGADEDEAADAAEAAAAQAAWAHHSDEEAERIRARSLSESFAASAHAVATTQADGSGHDAGADKTSLGGATPSGPSWEVHHKRQRSGSGSLLGVGLGGRPRVSPARLSARGSLTAGSASQTRPRAGSAASADDSSMAFRGSIRGAGPRAGSTRGKTGVAGHAVAARPRMFRLFSSHKPVTAVEAFVVPRSASEQLDRLLASIVASRGAPAALDAALIELRQGMAGATASSYTSGLAPPSARSVLDGERTPGALHSLRLVAPPTGTGAASGSLTEDRHVGGTRPRGGTRGSASSSDSGKASSMTGSSKDRDGGGSSKAGQQGSGLSLLQVASKGPSLAEEAPSNVPGTPPVYPRALRTPVAREGEDVQAPMLSRSPIVGGIGFGAPDAHGVADPHWQRRPPGGSAASSAAEPDGGRFLSPSAAGAAAANSSAIGGKLKFTRVEAAQQHQREDVIRAATATRLSSEAASLHWFRKLPVTTAAGQRTKRHPTPAGTIESAHPGSGIVESVKGAAAEAAIVADRILERGVNVVAGLVASVTGPGTGNGSAAAASAAAAAQAGDEAGSVAGGTITSASGAGAGVVSPSALQTAALRSLSAALGLQAPHAGTLAFHADADAATAAAVQHVVRLWCSLHKYASWQLPVQSQRQPVVSGQPELHGHTAAGAATAVQSADAASESELQRPESADGGVSNWSALFHAPATTALPGSDPAFGETLVLPSLCVPASAFERPQARPGTGTATAQQGHVTSKGFGDLSDASRAGGVGSGSSALASDNGGSSRSSEAEDFGADYDDYELCCELLQYDPLYEATRHCAGAARLPLRALLRPDESGGAEVSAAQVPAVASAGGFLGPLPGHTSPAAAALDAAAAVASSAGATAHASTAAAPSQLLGVTLTLPIIGGTGNITVQAALYEEEPLSAAAAAAANAAPQPLTACRDADSVDSESVDSETSHRRGGIGGPPVAGLQQHDSKHHESSRGFGPALVAPALAVAEQPGRGYLATALAGATAPAALQAAVAYQEEQDWERKNLINATRAGWAQRASASPAFAASAFAGLEPEAEGEAEAAGAAQAQRPLPTWSPPSHTQAAAMLPLEFFACSTAASAGSTAAADASPERSPLASPLATPQQGEMRSEPADRALSPASAAASAPQSREPWQSLAGPQAGPVGEESELGTPDGRGHAYDSSAASSSSADSALMAMEAAAAELGPGQGSAASRSALAQRFFLLSPDESSSALAQPEAGGVGGLELRSGQPEGRSEHHHDDTDDGGVKSTYSGPSGSGAPPSQAPATSGIGAVPWRHEAPPASPSSVSQLAAEFPDASLAAAESDWGRTVDSFLQSSVADDAQAGSVDASRKAGVNLTDSAADSEAQARREAQAVPPSQTETFSMVVPDRPAAPFDPRRMTAAGGGSESEPAAASLSDGGAASRSPMHVMMHRHSDADSDVGESLAAWPPDGQWIAPAADALTGASPAWPEPLRALSASAQTQATQPQASGEAAVDQTVGGGITPVVVQPAAVVAPASSIAAGQPGPRVTPLSQHTAPQIQAGAQTQSAQVGGSSASHGLSAPAAAGAGRRRAPSRTGLLQLSGHGGLLSSALVTMTPTSLALIAVGGATASESLAAAESLIAPAEQKDGNRRDLESDALGAEVAGVGAASASGSPPLQIRAPAAAATGGLQPASPLLQQLRLRSAAEQAKEQLRIQPAHVRAVQTGLFPPSLAASSAQPDSGRAASAGVATRANSGAEDEGPSEAALRLPHADSDSLARQPLSGFKLQPQAEGQPASSSSAFSSPLGSAGSRPRQAVAAAASSPAEHAQAARDSEVRATDIGASASLSQRSGPNPGLSVEHPQPLGSAFGLNAPAHRDVVAPGTEAASVLQALGSPASAAEAAATSQPAAAAAAQAGTGNGQQGLR